MFICPGPLQATAPLTSGAAGGSGSSRTHSFEHLSDHFAPPSDAGSDGEDDVPPPPSLPDLEALHDQPSPAGAVSPAMSEKNSITSASLTALQHSFAERLQLAAGPTVSPGTASLAVRFPTLADLWAKCADCRAADWLVLLLPARALRLFLHSRGVVHNHQAMPAHPQASVAEAASPLGSSYSDLASLAAHGSRTWQTQSALHEALAQLQVDLPPGHSSR